FGVTLNPLMLAGQVHGGAVQGLGQALMERAVYNADGQLVTPSLMDYALPRAADVPAFAFEARNVKCATHPLGGEGAGEEGAGGGGRGGGGGWGGGGPAGAAPRHAGDRREGVAGDRGGQADPHAVTLTALPLHGIVIGRVPDAIFAALE